MERIMFKQIGTKVLPLTPDIAESFSNMTAWRGERPLRESNLRNLTRRLEDGQFHSPKWSVAWLNGVQYRVDGQHSSRVLASANGHFPAGLNAVIDEYTCDDDSDLADLFMQFDNPTSSRSVSDVSNAHARIHPELDGVSGNAVRDCNAGIAFALSNDGEHAVKLGTEMRAKLVHDNIPFTVWASHFVGERSLRRVPVVAAMYKTWSKCHHEADRFWNLVKDESHPDPLNPSRVLAKFIRTRTNHSAEKSGGQFTSHAFFVKSIHAWNAWRRKQKTDLKYYPKTALPEAV
jgi:hypothetical protein